ncbi:thermonuclease family protein [Halodesulfovibrio sp. MK-HDV]|uniref:thermonuclease family protein n=1 Tax=Halodesulfovibrio sp. MK-HDV TaxID=2599925 RepID=UPI00136D911A|nr:thermonuclease family protein [Halodesulfovibrio sp. MK-HDV]KAF1077566.1 Thermonuclease [Halodesulfovibrio sp. MK-HDV]
MINRTICLLAILCLICVTVLTSFADTVHTVATVIDGDTVILKDGRKVRIAFIDTPEMEYKKRKQQYFSIKAKKFIVDTVLGQNVTLQRITAKDRYKRLVAIVTLRDGRDVGALLVQKGLAFVYPHGVKHRSYIDKLGEMQKKAMNARAGMWDKVITYFESAGNVVGNRRSKRFFALDCKVVKDIATKNKVHFMSAVDALYNGYAPARICKLWPLDTDILDK